MNSTEEEFIDAYESCFENEAKVEDNALHLFNYLQSQGFIISRGRMVSETLAAEVMAPERSYTRDFTIQHICKAIREEDFSKARSYKLLVEDLPSPPKGGGGCPK